MADSSAKYLHRRRPSGRVRSVMCGGRKSAGEIPYCPATAKRLRYKPDIYARYGGDDVDLPTGRTPVNDPIPLWPGPVRAIQPYCAAGEPVVVFPCGCWFQAIPGIPGRHTTGVGIPRAKADLLGSEIGRRGVGKGYMSRS